MKRDIYILGINESHVATAALLKNGEIIACASEERFTRKKGQWGFPIKAAEYCINEAGIKSFEIDGVFLGFKEPTISLNDNSNNAVRSASVLKNYVPFIKQSLLYLISLWPLLYDVYEFLMKHIFKATYGKYLYSKHKLFISEKLNISPDNIHRIDHHYAHAYAAYYSNNDYQKVFSKTSLVVSVDGMGDDVCSRIFSVKQNVWKEIASTPNKYTLGWLYLYVTEYLGMKPNEHEYKVMGLAPYANKEWSERVMKIFKKLMWVKGLTIKSSHPMLAYPTYIKKHLAGQRFDNIAGGIQMFTEEILLELIGNCLNKVKTDTVILCGGVFMNVKANMEIAKIDKIKNIFVMPSSGDESTAIGAAYYGYREYCKNSDVVFGPKALKTLYLGPEYGANEISIVIKKVLSKNKKISVSKKKNIEKEVALLLSRGEVVARFNGRMEFGARALGNRSIFANPSDPKAVRVINDQIKGRDFWMPFAPVILEERSKEYLLNKKNIKSPFMMIGFETTKKAKKDFIASLHPYDYTARPQILSESQNPSYYKIIREFEKLTGIPGLLNTSFNIHGEPIVCSPEDALQTFISSGLKYLQMGDYLVEKK